MPENKTNLYGLSTGAPVTSLTPFSNPTDEYCAAFNNRADLFLSYYALYDNEIQKLSLTRGEFWDLACSAATCLRELGLSRSERVVHCFSQNNLYDLVFRLAAVFVGCVPVTVNWQADDDDSIIYKVTVTNAKLVLYNKDFISRVRQIEPRLQDVAFFEAEEIKSPLPDRHFTLSQLSYDDEKMIIFTSGTTAKPKGVSLSHRSYLANRLTFEQYFEMSEATQLDLLLANPLHHSNSTALSDWGMRRAGARIHVLQWYATVYWQILIEVAEGKRDILVAPLVSRHIDFLDNLLAQSKSPVDQEKLKEALNKTDILIGSAPVGPTTVNRILRLSGHMPNVRFGSTETCLQVMGTPRTMPESELIKAFEVGWKHHYLGEKTVGYYIGREHFPYTKVKVVKSIDPDNEAYFKPCDAGEPGYFVTQGPNVMDYYVGKPEATKNVFGEGWYTGLRDIGFTLKNDSDGQLDYYWMSRDSTLLIRGGTNYSYDQIAAELSKVLIDEFNLKPEQFKLAAVGLRVESEHEDSCCVTIELSDELADARQNIERNYKEKALKKVSKGARPDYVRFAKIPLSFKGTILVPELKRDFKDFLRQECINVYD